MAKPLDLASIVQVPDLSAYIKQVDQRLRQSLVSDNSLISEPLLRLVGAGGKRIRATLIIAAAAGTGKKINNQVISACTAVELVHLGSLVHDDIIDNGTTRWGKPTINALEGTDHAVIIGDYILAKATEQAASLSAESGILVAGTIARICEGESREIGDRYNQDRTIESMLDAVANKTAALFSASCQIGGMCAGLSAKEIATLGRCGHQLGMAFQLIDDVLDFLSTPKLMGKPVGNDVAEGIYTMPIILTLRGPQSKTLKSLLKDKRSSPAELTQLLLENGAIQKTIHEVKEYNTKATKALRNLGNSDNKAAAGIISLPNAYLNWAMNNLVADQYCVAVSEFLA